LDIFFNDWDNYWKEDLNTDEHPNIQVVSVKINAQSYMAAQVAGPGEPGGPGEGEEESSGVIAWVIVTVLVLIGLVAGGFYIRSDAQSGRSETEADAGVALAET